MCWKLLILCVQFQTLVSLSRFPVHSETNRTKLKSKFTIDELLINTYAPKTSNDVDIDPCKAGKYAAPRKFSENNISGRMVFKSVNIQ